MDTDPPTTNNSPCIQRQLITRRISSESMLIRTYTELIKKFDDGSNPEMIQLVSKSADEHQSNLDALVSERDSLLPCLTFNCNYCGPSNSSTPVVEKAPVLISNSKENNTIETPINSTSPKNKNKIKKRNIKKDSVEDFVIPKKTARPVSPSIIEPVATNNSFSDLESEEVKGQNVTDEVKTVEVPKPKPANPIHLKIKDNI
ncbi:hypothetical protein TNIN_190331 [Trichonephila inaurata madagascariensis]|uniref:Uncharacterized protein n=1 Tax=Trichonephila inaurata madagascariensis TaxID=2747483 RepID=A0A8X7BZ23_9ARAC|nr:hypothetical protein TNIN_332371 [Trichonephila inaurata madagascariensis]GFY52589.1 hypothetical protein TNIN_190331 [Trichonephila inaurata madagascariensis]